MRRIFWSVFSCIQSEYRKIQTIKYSLFGHFSHSVTFSLLSRFSSLNSLANQQSMLHTRVSIVIGSIIFYYRQGLSHFEEAWIPNDQIINCISLDESLCHLVDWKTQKMKFVGKVVNLYHNIAIDWRKITTFFKRRVSSIL